MDIQEDTLWDLLKFVLLAGVMLPLGLVLVPVAVLAGLTLLLDYFWL